MDKKSFVSEIVRGLFGRILFWLAIVAFIVACSVLMGLGS